MGIVYVATNEGMKEFKNGVKIVKIGMTKNNETLESRFKSLNNSSVPYPFECEYAIDVGDKEREVEKRIHAILDTYRIRKGSYQREFFKINPQDAIDLLSVLEVMDGTFVVNPDEEKTVEDEDDRRIVRERMQKRKNFTFGEAGIPIGSILLFRLGDEITCEVVDDRKVRFRGKVTSLSRAATIILKDMGAEHKRHSAVAGTLYWLYEGRSLDEIRREKSALKSSADHDDAPTSDMVESREGTDAPSGRKTPRGRFTFSMLEIPVGSELTLDRDPAKTAKVVGDREIEYEGNTASLNKVTEEIFRKELGINWKRYRATNHWSFEGETLTDRRIRIEGSSD